MKVRSRDDAHPRSVIPKGGVLVDELPVVQLDYTTIGSWTTLGLYVLGLMVGGATPIPAKPGLHFLRRGFSRY